MLPNPRRPDYARRPYRCAPRTSRGLHRHSACHPDRRRPALCGPRRWIRAGTSHRAMPSFPGGQWRCTSDGFRTPRKAGLRSCRLPPAACRLPPHRVTEISAWPTSCWSGSPRGAETQKRHVVFPTSLAFCAVSAPLREIFFPGLKPAHQPRLERMGEVFMPGIRAHAHVQQAVRQVVEFEFESRLLACVRGGREPLDTRVVIRTVV